MDDKPVKMVKCLVAGCYQNFELNTLAKKIKDGDRIAIRLAAEKMSPLVKKGDILVPVPSHNGRAEYTLTLSRQIATLTGAVVMDALAGEKRESSYLLKKKGIMLQAGDLGFRLVGQKPEGHVLVVDNVIASGNTARAAVDVVPGATVLALANDPFAVGRRKDISIENFDAIKDNEEKNKNQQDKIEFSMDKTELKDKSGIISDVVTYPGLNMNERFIHCSIGGVRQPAKKLSDEDNKRLNEVMGKVRETKNWAESRSFRMELAEKYYKGEVEQFGLNKERTNGLKR